MENYSFLLEVILFTREGKEQATNLQEFAT